MSRADTTRERRERAEKLAIEIYSRHRTYLLRIAERNAPNPDDAEEALQEALMAFIAKFDPEGEAHPMAWITLTLKRACWAAYRRQRLDINAGQEVNLAAGEVGTALELIPDHARGPEALAELRDRVTEVRDQLAGLKPDERRALGLLALGYSYKEIGALTGWTHTKINRCLAEGRAHLRALAAS